ncbi:MAG: potassium transporter KtrB [Clostridia bacterium]|nr:potassium transporter KtrB [Clostridia bacterium]
MKRRGIRESLSTTHIIMISFLCVILLGSLLLSLPVSAADGEPVPYIDALFTATTATCVTGLVTLTTATAWSLFGQTVILLLIQVGGLGIITVMAGVMLALHRRMGLTDRLLLQDSFNLNSLSGLSSFLGRVIIGTFAVEAAGALLYMTVLVPEFGPRGIWYAVFNAVSAFCNAGMDVIGENSLMNYATNPLVNTVTSLLIVLGGLGFPVWWDILRVIGLTVRKRNPRFLSHLTLQSKMALTATAILLFGGGLIILLLENNNPATLGGLSFFDKVQVALFQSVTTRTAGFATVDQAALTPASTVLCLILMFIGGSPVGTAGGVKTVTVLVLAVYAFSTVRGRNEVGLFNRRIPRDALRKSVAVVGMSFLIAAVSTLLLAAVTPDRELADILYETVSATATVGLSRNLTPTLTTAGKLIVAVTMYLGRVGPISLAVAFGVTKEKQNIVNNPTEPVSVG